MPDMENLRDTVYPVEWPGFPGESDARNQARADLRVVEQLSEIPSGPDWPTLTAIYKREEAEAFAAADKSPIYDYEIEAQRPVQPFARVNERVSWRQRAKHLMSKASEAVRDASIATFTVAQVKSEELKEYYADEQAGKKRRRVSAVIAGALAAGTTIYLATKGVSSGSSHSRAVHEAASVKPHVNASRHIHHAVAEASPSTVTEHDGQNPWTISEQHLRDEGIAHPSNGQIATYDQRMARANPDVYTYGDDSAEHIQAGTRLRLP